MIIVSYAPVEEFSCSVRWPGQLIYTYFSYQFHALCSLSLSLSSSFLSFHGSWLLLIEWRIQIWRGIILVLFLYKPDLDMNGWLYSYPKGGMWKEGKRVGGGVYNKWQSYMHSNFLSIFLLFGMIKRLLSCLSINKLSTNQTVKSLIKLHRGYLQKKKKNYTEASHVYPHPISIHQSIMTGILGRKNMERKYYAKKMDVCNRVKCE